MKLREQYSWSSNRTFTIGQAVKAGCDGSDWERGQVETAQSAANNAAEMLAKLVEVLHEGGKLSDDEVLELFGGHYEIVAD